MILVDTNIIIDMLSPSAAFAEWSRTALAEAVRADRVGINPIIYAEVAAGFSSRASLDEALNRFDRLPLPYEAGLLAGQVFGEYRRRGGVRNSALPDFYIGAHAAVHGMTILTRDVDRYRSYFPKVELIAP